MANCACGHDHLIVFLNMPPTIRTVACYRRVPAQVIGPQPCPCRSYRTPEQQEAWEVLSRAANDGRLLNASVAWQWSKRLYDAIQELTRLYR